MVSPYTQHINMQLSTDNIVNILSHILNFYLKRNTLDYNINYFDLLCDIFFKELLPEYSAEIYTVYNAILSYGCIWTCWSYFS